MKIAIVGSGAAGLGAALALQDHHDVALFEKQDRFGGHANTVEVPTQNGPVPVDTGFIVYNERNYPNLCGLFEHLDAPTTWSDMSLGFSLDNGRFEYACDDLNSIFAQRRNILNPRFLWTARDVMRFIRIAPAELASGALTGLTLGEWLDKRGFGDWFRNRFLLPMGAAIWSTPTDQMLAFPAANFVAFFANHDLFTGFSPAMRWRTVKGGSREYVSRVVSRLSNRVHKGVGVAAATRQGAKVELRFEDGSSGLFDQVVFASHAPDTRRIVTDLDGEERALLSAFQTTSNRAILHSDPALMPKRRRAWSSWSMMAGEGATRGSRPVSLSYWMNRLQELETKQQFFVTLNAERDPDPLLTHASFDYAHPRFDQAAFAAQAEMDRIQGRGGYWYAGAWLGWGFHEDALKAGLRVAEALGARPAWARDLGPGIDAAPVGLAAE